MCLLQHYIHVMDTGYTVETVADVTWKLIVVIDPCLSWPPFIQRHCLLHTLQSPTLHAACCVIIGQFNMHY